MNDLDSLRLMVKHYPGGIEVMALRLGKTVEVLRKELAGAGGFKLGLLTAMTISELCIEADSENCRAFVNAVTASSGGFVRLPVREMASPACVQRSLAEVIKEFSDVSVSTIEVDADGVISDNDLARALPQIGEAREALQQLERSLREKNAAGKPGGVQTQSVGQWRAEYDRTPA